VVTRINPLVDQVVARRSAIAGGGTLLGYAFDVASLPTSIAQAAFFSIFLTHIAERTHDRTLFRSTLHHALFSTVAAIGVLSGILYFVRTPLTELLFHHDAMGEGSVAIITGIVPYALVGAAPFGALLILARAHVALKNTKIMLTMGVLNAALNALFNTLLFPHFGLAGIALSTSFMHTAVALVFYFRLKSPMSVLASSSNAQ
jgi:peptidoglycan biosynthesis protein MviN/MurJ (putative lipid II flippase)